MNAMLIRAQADALAKPQTPGTEKKPLPDAKPAAKSDAAPSAVDAKNEQTPRLDGSAIRCR